MKQGKPAKSPETRAKLVAAATALIRVNGYSATSVDRICVEAGVTKGAFFHYFKSKEEIARAAVEAWCQWGKETYTGFQGPLNTDPRERLDHLLNNMISMTTDPAYTPLVCLLGMVAQETGSGESPLREACDAGLTGWTGMVAALFQEIAETHPVSDFYDPKQLAWMFNSLWQGSMLIAKTHRDTSIVADNLRQFRNHIENLLTAESSVS